MQAALADDAPDLAERTVRAEEFVERSEAERGRAREPIAEELRLEDSLGHSPQDPRPSLGGRDGENSRPGPYVFEPTTAAVEVEIAANLPSEDPGAFSCEVDLDEGVQRSVLGGVHQMRVRHDEPRAEPLSGLPVALPVEKLVSGVGAGSAPEGEGHLGAHEPVTHERGAPQVRLA